MEKTGGPARSSGDVLSFLDRHKVDLALVLLVILAAFLVRAYGLMDAGVTWDEKFYVEAGITYIDNLAHMRFDHGAWTANNEHPPVSKYFYGAVIWLFNDGSYDLGAFYVSRVLSAAMGAAICGIVFLFCAELYDRRTAIAAAFILALLPVFVAHTQIAALDSPVALFFTLTLYLFTMALKRESRWLFLASAVSLGLLVSTKFNGFLVLPILLLEYLLYQRAHPEINGRLKRMFFDQADRRGWLGRLDSFAPIVPFVILLLVAGLVFYLLWPWIWNSPLNLGRSIKHWTYTPHEYLLGSVYQPMPVYYYPLYFLVSTPLLLLPLFAAGLYSALKTRDPLKYLPVIWFAFPFVYGLSYFVQGTMRYLLMIYPAVAILCALGVTSLARWLGRLRTHLPIESATFWLALAAIVLYLAATLASFSPYYLDYYNAAGGSSKDIYAKKLYQFGWWGEGLYDSVSYLENNAEPGSIVYVAAKPDHQIWLYQKNLTYLNSTDYNLTAPENADYIITDTFSEWYCNISFNQSAYKLIYETDLHGAPLARVYEKI